MDPEQYLPIAYTLIGVVVAYVLYLFIVSGGSFGRYWQTRALARRMMRDPSMQTKINDLMYPKPVPPPPPPKPSAEPIRLLARLQREGRLLDFLLENIQAYSNEDIGAAVRDIHRNSQKVLNEHLTLEPILKGEEHSTVEVPPGFNPSAIRLTGNVTGTPPFKGTLMHHGWRVKAIKLQKPAEGQDEFVLQPAEVEL